MPHAVTRPRHEAKFARETRSRIDESRFQVAVFGAGGPKTNTKQASEFRGGVSMSRPLGWPPLTYRGSSMSSKTDPSPSAFRPVPRTGVIYVTVEAQRAGFRAEDASWCNLGQGQPETGPLPGAPERVTNIVINGMDQEYAPVGGLWEVREAVAGMYNDLYRRGMPSRYSAENVAVCGGGRVSIMRACAAIGQINLGHFLPDYTAYEELLDIFRRFTPIPILLDSERGYEFSIAELEREISGRGLGALLLSNPCNPTGKAILGPELAAWVGVARKLDCTLLLDEFYTHYLWNDGPALFSAAEYVEDVERDPVVIFDGLTKNWRYPGWRVTWTVGPSKVIEALASAGSFLDGGGSRRSGPRSGRRAIDW
jgi:aspartate/methionine/tyrosine aminotransferase